MTCTVREQRIEAAGNEVPEGAAVPVKSLRRKESTGMNRPVATRAMAGLAGRLKWQDG